jgi:hypothetical protein
MNVKQKDNLAKFSYDLGKIVLAITVITPLAKSEAFHFLSTTLGLMASASVVYFGYFLDSLEVRDDNI